MKLPKKTLLLPGVAVGLLLIGGTTWALTRPDPTPTKTLDKTQTATVQKTPVVHSTTTVTPAEQTSQATQQAAESTDTPPATYGEDPNNPGVFIVFDKTAVMTAAGIPTDQQADTDKLLSKMMQWRYKQTAIPESDICYVVPVSKMAIMGADYRDNPVTQLKYCDKLVVARYATWTAALAQYKGSGGF